MAGMTTGKSGWILAGLIVSAGVFAGVASAVSPFGVPISDRVVQGEFSVDDLGTVRFAAREGTVITVQDTKSDKALGLSPALQGVGRGSVDFLVLELSGPDLGTVHGYEPEPIATVRPASSLSMSTPLGPGVLSVERVVLGSFSRRAPDRAADSRPRELQERFGRTGGETCCVTCGRITSCASAIQIDCGTCESAGVAQRE